MLISKRGVLISTPAYTVAKETSSIPWPNSLLSAIQHDDSVTGLKIIIINTSAMQGIFGASLHDVV